MRTQQVWNLKLSAQVLTSLMQEKKERELDNKVILEHQQHQQQKYQRIHSSLRKDFYLDNVSSPETAVVKWPCANC